jgi:hypothetical protein
VHTRIREPDVKLDIDSLLREESPDAVVAVSGEGEVL